MRRMIGLYFNFFSKIFFDSPKKKRKKSIVFFNYINRIFEILKYLLCEKLYILTIFIRIGLTLSKFN